MTLKFDRTPNGDISICIYEGTNMRPFSYIELINKLMARENIESDFSEQITDEEKKQIEELLLEIKNIVNPTNSTQNVAR